MSDNGSRTFWLPRAAYMQIQIWYVTPDLDVAFIQMEDAPLESEQRVELGSTDEVILPPAARVGALARRKQRNRALNVHGVSAVKLAYAETIS